MTLLAEPEQSSRRLAGTRRALRSLEAFSLLEVLAAVAILAIWYVVIAAMATDGLRKQGISNRLLEASEIAGRLITEIEATAVQGIAPELRDEETQEGDFFIRVLVVPFGFGMSEPIRNEGVGSSKSAPGMQQLLTTAMPGMSGHLVSINVSVSWQEAADLRTINRTSYAFDLASAKEVYESEEAKEAKAEEESDREANEDDRDTDFLDEDEE